MSAMKKRIQVDSAILTLLIILSGIGWWFNRWAPFNQLLDNSMDFLGVLLILKGTYVRMAARGHKRANSGDGHNLVMTGPYSFVRNPMYLGTFLIGAGFVLVLWPWWMLPVYVFLFYLRFQNYVIRKEESNLRKQFGDRFEQYVREVPSIFPSFKRLREVNLKTTFPWAEAWHTKDKYNFICWPIAAFAFELIKDQLMLGYTDILQTFLVFVLAIVVFATCLWWEYSRA
jgi:protein-S-isoprenylcysteine O-methyltransferase Ste14